MEASAKATIDSPLGRLVVHTEQDLLTNIYFDPRSSVISPATRALKHIYQQLSRYFNGDACMLDEISVMLDGTDFQRKVWQQVRAIPNGQTRTYGQIAKTLASSPRAVGNACRHNPIPIIIPCHRVVAAHGLGGYAGATSGKRLDTKKWLLNHESNPGP